jgi:hypothetical protein
MPFGTEVTQVQHKIWGLGLAYFGLSILWPDLHASASAHAGATHHPLH